MLRSVLSVIEGYVVMAVVVMIGTIAATAALVPGGLAAMKNAKASPPITPSRNYLAANLLISLIGAILGGWVTARVAIYSPMIHVGILALLIVAMSFLSARKQGSTGQPSWYPMTIAVLGIAGVLLGGVLAARNLAA
jgi:predicted MFS family arabinose efflux permease